MAVPSEPHSTPLTGVIDQRLTLLVQRARQLRLDGLDFPIDDVRTEVEAAVRLGDSDRVEVALKRGELLMERAQRDWHWLRRLLDRANEVRGQAEVVGLDIDLLDARVGNPREQLHKAPLSDGALEKTAASASFSLAVLSNALPKFLLQETRQLAESTKAAERRGESTHEATERLSRFIRAVREGDIAAATRRFLEFRTAVAQIPRAPALTAAPSSEADAILQEARNLARRINRMKGRARDARGAARLVAQVRAALSEDRRFGTPEEEIEELWEEVDRLTRQRLEAGDETSSPAPLAQSPLPGIPLDAVDPTRADSSFQELPSDANESDRAFDGAPASVDDTERARRPARPPSPNL